MLKNGWVWFAVLLVVGFIAWPHHGTQDPVIPGVTVRIDTVKVHDTITTNKKASDFTVKLKPVPPAPQIAIEALKTDSAAAPSKDTVKDSATCYSFSQDYANGAHAMAEMCSRFFPKVKPWDVSGVIKYRPGNDTMRIETRVDSVPKIIYKKPIIPTWQAVTLGVAAGVLATIMAVK